MEFVKIMQYIGRHSVVTLRIAPIAIVMVIAAEGLQHIVEWQLGMYRSRNAFIAHQDDSLRLTFGIIKALSVLAACYLIPKALSVHFELEPRHGSFAKDFIRKFWDPRENNSAAFVIMLILALPLIFLHIKLSELAMGHLAAPFLLFLDTILIGGLALLLGLCFWASDAIKSQIQFNPI